MNHDWASNLDLDFAARPQSDPRGRRTFMFGVDKISKLVDFIHITGAETD
jgi:hypothetical protein